MPAKPKTRTTTGLHHLALRAKDFDRSLRFYKDTLGLTEKLSWDQAPKRAVMLDTGDGCCIEIFEKPQEQWADSDACILHFALSTPDCRAALEKARAAGAPVTMEPTDIDLAARPKPVKIRIAFCKGPDGEVVEFFQQR